MLRSMFTHWGLPAIALATALSLVVTNHADARGGGGHGGGGFHGGGFHGGGFHGGGFHGGGFHGGGWGGYRGGWGGYYGRGYRGYGWGGYWPYYAGYGLGYGLGWPYYDSSLYSDSYNDYPYPDYYSSYYYAPESYNTATYAPYDDSGLGSAPYTEPPADVASTSGEQLGRVVAANVARVRVTLPANAELWFDGHRTSQTGSVREFSTPPITPGTEYSYQLRARWTRDGHEVERTRNIEFQAGDRVAVNLMSPSGKAPATPSTAVGR